MSRYATQVHTHKHKPHRPRGSRPGLSILPEALTPQPRHRGLLRTWGGPTYVGSASDVVGWRTHLTRASKIRGGWGREAVGRRPWGLWGGGATCLLDTGLGFLFSSSLFYFFETAYRVCPSSRRVCVFSLQIYLRQLQISFAETALGRPACL
jgi:hypothetical protein